VLVTANALGVSATYSGDWEPITHHPCVLVSIKSDVDSADGCISVEFTNEAAR